MPNFKKIHRNALKNVTAGEVAKHFVESLKKRDSLYNFEQFDKELFFVLVHSLNNSLRTIRRLDYRLQESVKEMITNLNDSDVQSLKHFCRDQEDSVQNTPRSLYNNLPLNEVLRGNAEMAEQLGTETIIRTEDILTSLFLTEAIKHYQTCGRTGEFSIRFSNQLGSQTTSANIDLETFLKTLIAHYNRPSILTSACAESDPSDPLPASLSEIKNLYSRRRKEFDRGVVLHDRLYSTLYRNMISQTRINPLEEAFKLVEEQAQNSETTSSRLGSVN